MNFGQALECFEQLLALPQHLLIAFSFSILQIPNSAQDYSASRCALSFRSLLVASCSTFSFSTRRAAFSSWLAFAIFSFSLSFSEILCHCVASCCWCADCIWAVCCRSCFSTPAWPSWIFSCFCVCVSAACPLPSATLRLHSAFGSILPSRPAGARAHLRQFAALLRWPASPSLAAGLADSFWLQAFSPGRDCAGEQTCFMHHLPIISQVIYP